MDEMETTFHNEQLNTHTILESFDFLGKKHPRGMTILI